MSGYSKLSVVQVRTAVPATTGAEAGMVVLQEDGYPKRSLRIIIGMTEAKAIHTAWQGAVAGRPSTWDLFVSAITVLGATLKRVVITSVEQERHYFATLELDDHGEVRSLSCRPSDGIALALRAPEAEIVVAEEVLMAAAVMPDGSKPDASIWANRPAPPAIAGPVGAAPEDPEPAPAESEAAADPEPVVASETEPAVDAEPVVAAETEPAADPEPAGEAEPAAEAEPADETEVRL